MYKVTISSRVKKIFKKLDKRTKDNLVLFFIKLEKNPFTPELKTHKLTGRLKGSYACSLSYGDRVILITEKEILVTDFGSHDEVY